MSIKTYRDIKKRQNIAIKQRATSMTSQTEERLKMELVQEFGPILTEEERFEIATREKRRKGKQDAAITKSRLKMLKVKEIAKETQLIRLALNERRVTGSHIDSENKKIHKQGFADDDADDADEFRTMKISY